MSAEEGPSKAAMPHQPSQPGAALPAGLPADWHFERDLPCPNCRYNLRMLRTPRCPECGTPFRWQQLLLVSCPRCAQPLGDAGGNSCPRCGLPLKWSTLFNDAPVAKRASYEYAGQPFWAGVRTWFALLLPRYFWRRIPLGLPPATPRLRKFRAAALLSGLIGLFAMLPTALVTHRMGTWVTVFTIVTGLPLLTTFMLPRFTPTLTRFNIRRDQLLRCLAYGAAGIAWIGVLLVAFAVYGQIIGGATGRSLRVAKLDLHNFLRCPHPWTLLGGDWHWLRYAWRSHYATNGIVCTLIALLAFVWWWRFLYVSLKHYLRLSRTDAVALLLSTQLISLLLLALFLLGALLLIADGRRLLAAW